MNVYRVLCASLIPAPSASAPLARLRLAGRELPHRVLIGSTRSPRGAQPSEKGVRRPGRTDTGLRAHACVRRRAFFLTIHLTCYRAPARLNVRTHVVIIYHFVKPRPWASAQGIASFPPPSPEGGGPTTTALWNFYSQRVSFRKQAKMNTNSILIFVVF